MPPVLQASHKRKLHQFTPTPPGPNPFVGIANAFRFIFSNTFDWFRARGALLSLATLDFFQAWPHIVLQLLQVITHERRQRNRA
jgi:hypothetical protein